MKRMIFIILFLSFTLCRKEKPNEAPSGVRHVDILVSDTVEFIWNRQADTFSCYLYEGDTLYVSLKKEYFGGWEQDLSVRIVLSDTHLLFYNVIQNDTNIYTKIPMDGTVTIFLKNESFEESAVTRKYMRIWWE